MHEIPPYLEYTKLLKKEISVKAKVLNKNLAAKRQIETLYLGGGTPSLLPVDLIEDLKKHLSECFDLSKVKEFTLECNPGTISTESLQKLQTIGVNRLSIGAQTFHEPTLKTLGRKHSVDETLETLKIAQDSGINYTLDLMYALPKQTLESFQKDIEIALQFDPKHISLYYLTLPNFHALNQNRPHEDVQLEMFDTLEEQLSKNGIFRYEISNFSKPGFESKHNSLYWTDKEYVGFGLSSHSYIKNTEFGVRFWNPRTYSNYENYLQKLHLEQEAVFSFLPEKNIERLRLHEALTDFCHTSLRRMMGLNMEVLTTKFPEQKFLVQTILDTLIVGGLITQKNPSHFALSQQGKRLTNLVFEKLTFLEGDVVRRSLD